MTPYEFTHPALIIIRGIPGSGKSTVAAQLQAIAGPDSCTLLDPDAIDVSDQQYVAFASGLQAEGINVKFHPYRYLRAQAFDAIEKEKVIIWNQAFIDFNGLEATIRSLKEYAKSIDRPLAVLIVELEVPAETAKQRVATRTLSGGHTVPDAVFERFVNDYERYDGQGYATITVDGTGDVQQSVESVFERLHSL